MCDPLVNLALRFNCSLVAIKGTVPQQLLQGPQQRLQGPQELLQGPQQLLKGPAASDSPSAATRQQPLGLPDSKATILFYCPEFTVTMYVYTIHYTTLPYTLLQTVH